MRGEVTSVHKTGYYVRVGDNTVFAIINNSYLGDDKPVVGDVVEMDKRADQHIILGIQTRKNYIARYDHFRERYQGFAANVDVIFVVTSANREFSPNRVRRFLALSGDQNVRKIIVLTKIDMATELPEIVKTIQTQFAGIEHIAINALDRAQVDKLKKLVKKGQSMLLLGSSGVGKSTIINTLAGTNIKTNEVKDERHFNKGKHTTSSRNMYYTPCGRKIIDVPGVRIVGIEREVAQSSELFDTIMDLAVGCKFRNCAHKTEDGCAVKAAIENGDIEPEELQWYFDTLDASERDKKRTR
ncbi:MAG: ribosome small subunit-dependent GTPase A [Firmicutes bacterium]|nr:ribosome small subunit-dependent GTPase A [Bacillota bacterium]